MKRLIVVAISSVTCLAASTAVSNEMTYFVLDSPEAFSRLEKSNPGHYEKALATIVLAKNTRCETPPNALLATLGVTSAKCNVMKLRTSNPPQADFTFRIENTEYMTRISIPNDRTSLRQLGR